MVYEVDLVLLPLHFSSQYVHICLKPTIFTIKETLTPLHIINKTEKVGRGCINNYKIAGYIYVLFLKLNNISSSLVIQYIIYVFIL